MKNILVLGFLVTLAVSADAGVGAHGGNIVVCAGNSQPVTLDYFNASLPTLSGPADVVDVSQMSQQEVIDLVRSRFHKTPFLGLFDKAAEQIGPFETWILADLISVGDSDEPYFLPDQCKRLTAAIRQGSSMYLDPTVFSKLSPAQRGLLYVHEMLYWLYGKDSSAPVREMLRLILRKNPTTTEIAKSLKLIEQPYTLLDFVKLTVGPDTGLLSPDDDLTKALLMSLSFSQNNKIYSASLGSHAIDIFGNSPLDCSKDDFACDFNTYTKYPEAETCQLTSPTLNHFVVSCPKTNRIFKFVNIEKPL